MLRNRDLRLLLTGRFCILMAAQMASVAVGWHVYSVTQSTLHLGWVGLVQFVPMLVLTLPAGYAADRVDRRLLGAGSVVLMTLGTLGLLATIAFELPLVAVYGALGALGVARAGAGPSLSALMPELVPTAQFRKAVASMSLTVQTAMVAGPAVGGLLYAGFSAETTFAAAAALQLLGAVLLFAIRPRPRAPSAEAISLRTVLAGLSYLRTQPVLLGAISLDLFAVLLGGATALIPAVARDVLEVGPAGLGWLRAAPSLGALVVGVLLSLRPPDRGAGKRLLGTVALFGVSITVFGLSSNFALSLAALFLSGAADMWSVFVRQTLVQLWTPDAMRGRVSAVHMVFVTGSNELGEFESGVTAAWFGLRNAIVLGGLGTLAIALTWAKLFPALRALDGLTPPVSHERGRGDRGKAP